ncbi:MAG: acyl-CoA thioesterase [Pseudomonadales bacterium]
MNTSEKLLRPFCNVLKVRFSDLDPQGHLYFANYMVYADEVLTNYMEELGFDATKPHKTQCLIFTVNIHCDYLDEIAGNSEVRVNVGYSRLGNSSADAAFELYDNAAGTVLAKGGLTQVFVDPQTRKSTLIPSLFRAAILKRQPGLTACR